MSIRFLKDLSISITDKGFEFFPRGLMEMKSGEDVEGSSQLFYAFTSLYTVAPIKQYFFGES